MKKVMLILIIFFLIFVSSGCNNKKENNTGIDLLQDIESSLEFDSIPFDSESIENAIVFLDIDYFEEIAVYNNKGEVFFKIKNDSVQEDYVLFCLIDKSDSMFFVEAYSSLSNNIITRGWIKRSSHLGIFSSMYQGNISLYEKPDDKSKIINVIRQYSPDVYEVVDFKDNWLKIIAKERDISFEGWLPPEEQCCNVYSTCN